MKEDIEDNKKGIGKRVNKKVLFGVGIVIAFFYYTHSVNNVVTEEHLELIDVNAMRSGSDRTCYNISDVATNVMAARQSGVSRNDLIEASRKGDAELIGLYQGLINDAFSREVIRDNRNLERVSRDFGSEYYRKCLMGNIK